MTNKLFLVPLYSMAEEVDQLDQSTRAVRAPAYETQITTADLEVLEELVET